MTQIKKKRNNDYSCDKHKVRRHKSIKFGVISWLFQRVKHETKKTGKEGFPDQSQQAYVKQLCLRLRYPRFTPTTQRRNRKGAWAQENRIISILLSQIFDTPNEFFMSYIEI